MQITEWKWKTDDGMEMYSKAWSPDEEAKAVLCLVHGLGEHIGRYEEDGRILTEADYALAGFDQRGFGRSEGKRGHIESFEEYLVDIESFLLEVKRRFPGKKLVLSGFSMGGVLAIVYTQLRHHELSGVIAWSPGLKTELEDRKWKILLAKMLGRFFPRLTFSTGLNTQRASRNPSVASELLNDPLVHFKVTAAWARSMIKLLELAWKNPQGFPVPLLLMHGTADEIAYPEGTTRFADLAPRDKVTFKPWDGMKHELRTDPEKDAVFRYVVDWLEEKI